MITGDLPDDFDLRFCEALQIAIANQILAVFVMQIRADMPADIVEQGTVLNQLAITAIELVDLFQSVKKL